MALVPRAPELFSKEADRMNRTLARWLQAPSIILLLIWMIVPLSMTVYFSTQRYLLQKPELSGFIGWSNF